MVEQPASRVRDGSVPIIPYDLFEAATLFLSTGRTLEDVLPRLGLDQSQWERVRDTYRWFPHGSGDAQKRRFFGDLDDGGILRLVLPPRWTVREGDRPDLRTTWHVREAVRRNPHVGPFATCGWPLTFIAAHPTATLCCYTHDGCTVYFDGKPLTDRRGHRLDVDAESFACVGGRWLRDKRRIYGQGEVGPKPTVHWYVVEGADRDSFRALNLRYARDDARAYYITGKVIRTGSPDAFEIVPEPRLNYRDCACDLLRDTSLVARDREAVYFYGARLKGARPATFRPLGHGYASDGVAVWLLDEKVRIEGADAATFTVPGPGEPYVKGRGGHHGATDRACPYDGAEPCDPHAWFEPWRPFFEARTDLDGWWWHELARGTR